MKTSSTGNVSASNLLSRTLANTPPPRPSRRNWCCSSKRLTDWPMTFSSSACTDAAAFSRVSLRASAWKQSRSATVLGKSISIRPSLQTVKWRSISAVKVGWP